MKVLRELLAGWVLLCVAGCGDDSPKMKNQPANVGPSEKKVGRPGEKTVRGAAD